MQHKPRTASSQTKRLVSLALFTAIIVVLQFLGSFIRLGTFSISLVLVPIVIGAVLHGPAAGAYLGAVFAVVVFASGDANLFLTVSPVGTVITVLCKGIACGLCAGLVYRLLRNVNEYVAIVAAAIVCPVVNSGLFLLGCLLFFGGFIATLEGYSGSVLSYVLVFFIGGNFVFELLVNAVLSPVIVRLTRLGRQK